MHGSRQEGAGWGGVEINLSNTKSKKKKASERPPPPPHLGKHHHPSLRGKKFWIRACNMYLNQIRLGYVYQKLFSRSCHRYIHDILGLRI